MESILIVLEILYYISGVVLAVGIVFAYKQLKLMKDDIKTKNHRSAIEKSVEYMDWYANTFIPEHEKFSKQLRKEKDIKLSFDFQHENFRVSEELLLSDEKVLISIVTKVDAGFVTLANQLEFFSSVMISGLADEEQVFLPVGDLFVDFMDENRELYCFLRRKSDDKFGNSVKLYNLWKSRLEEQKLDKQLSELERKRSTLKSAPIDYIGKL